MYVSSDAECEVVSRKVPPPSPTHTRTHTPRYHAQSVHEVVARMPEDAQPAMAETVAYVRRACLPFRVTSSQPVRTMCAPAGSRSS